MNAGNNYWKLRQEFFFEGNAGEAYHFNGEKFISNSTRQDEFR